MADSQSDRLLIAQPAIRHPHSRYAGVFRVLWRVFLLNLGVAAAKIGFGYATGSIAILSDGFHSLTDGAGNVVALIGVRAARKPPDADHPYGHRKYETLAAAGILGFLMLVTVEVFRGAIGRLRGGGDVEVGGASFAVMIATLAVNVFVVWYERREAGRLASEVLLADAMHTQSDMLTSGAVIAALAGVALGYPVLDAAAGLVVVGFIARAAWEIGRHTSGILADRIVIAEDDLREVVLTVPAVLGCHQIRTRGSADHVFLDLHIWLSADTRLEDAHQLSHEVKDRLIARYPQIVDAIIHIEPPPISEQERRAGGR